MKARARPAWASRLRQEVAERDGSLCVLCGGPAVDIQHIIPRSWGKPFSRRIWRIENMACTCRACHQHTTEARLRFIAKMAEQYDMTWVREFGIVLEEETNV